MKGKKPPERMCVACRQMKPKSELLRIVRAPDGTISLDPSGRKNGRGAYICRSLACFEKCKKTKQLSRTFSAEIGDEVYDALIKELTEN